MKYLLILSMLMMGCNFSNPAKKTTPPTNPYCKKVGKKKGKYTTVLIRRGCLKRGRTTIVVWFHSIKPGMGRNQATILVKKGIEESVKTIINILGYRPKLAFLPVPKVRGYFSYTFIVVE